MNFWWPLTRSVTVSCGTEPGVRLEICCYVRTRVAARKEEHQMTDAVGTDAIRQLHG